MLSELSSGARHAGVISSAPPPAAVNIETVASPAVEEEEEEEEEEDDDDDDDAIDFVVGSLPLMDVLAKSKASADSGMTNPGVGSISIGEIEFPLKPSLGLTRPAASHNESPKCNKECRHFPFIPAAP